MIMKISVVKLKALWVIIFPKFYGINNRSRLLDVSAYCPSLLDPSYLKVMNTGDVSYF